MEVVKIENKYFDKTAELVSLFRVTLREFKGIKSEPDIASAREELDSFMHDAMFQIYVCLDNEDVVGYINLKIDGPIWVEQIFVREDYRRKGVGTLLYEKAEDISNNLGEDTMYNYVHPNNDKMINFLRSKGYTVLNLIEIRKPWKKENLNEKIKIRNNIFDY